MVAWLLLLGVFEYLIIALGTGETGQGAGEFQAKSSEAEESDVEALSAWMFILQEF